MDTPHRTPARTTATLAFFPLSIYDQLRPTYPTDSTLLPFYSPLASNIFFILFLGELELPEGSRDVTDDAHILRQTFPDPRCLSIFGRFCQVNCTQGMSIYSVDFAVPCYNRVVFLCIALRVTL